MTTLNKVVKKCGCCGALYGYSVVMSSSTFDLPDLDSRPAPLARYNLQYEIQKCPKCNYASIDVSRKMDFDKNILKSEKYLKVLESSYPEYAKNYILASMIMENAKDYDSAGRLMIRACWALDDSNMNAFKERIVAAKLLERADNSEDILTMIVDLYRRAMEFEKAREALSKAFDNVENDFIIRILKCEEVLIDAMDSDCHSCKEIDNIIGAEPTEEIESDSMEDVKRKLFDPNCKEPLYINVRGEITTFEQIAIMPLEIDGVRKIYTILHVIGDYMDDDEALVFELVGENDLEELALVKDDDLVDKVFDEYYRLVNEQEGEE